MTVDDYGCFFADPKRLKANLFPLRIDEVSDSDILGWLSELEQLQIILVYEHQSKKWLQINDFRQRLRTMKGLYPRPSDDSQLADKRPSDDSQLADKRPLETESETKFEEILKHVPDGKPPAPTQPPLKKIQKVLFRESEFFGHPECLAAALAGTRYQNADIGHYYEAMLNWSDANNERKVDWLATAKNWMSRDLSEGKFVRKRPPGQIHTRASLYQTSPSLKPL